jgi:hypothetical protein
VVSALNVELPVLLVGGSTFVSDSEMNVELLVWSGGGSTLRSLTTPSLPSSVPAV